MSDAELDEDVSITTGEDIIGTIDSLDVDQGLGKPLGGELSSELHHNGMHKRTREKQGLERVGAGKASDKVPSKVTSQDSFDMKDSARAN